MAKKIETQIYQSLDDIVPYFRSLNKKYNIIFAHNGVGKTRLSMAFKDLKKMKEQMVILCILMHTRKIYSHGIMIWTTILIGI